MVRHFGHYEMLCNPFHGGRHLGTTGTTIAKTITLYYCYPLVLKLNVTLARPLRLVILNFFKWKILSDDRRLYLHNSK